MNVSILSHLFIAITHHYKKLKIQPSFFLLCTKNHHDKYIYHSFLSQYKTLIQIEDKREFLTLKTCRFLDFLALFREFIFSKFIFVSNIWTCSIIKVHSTWAHGSVDMLPKGRWFKSRCGHLMFCVLHLDKVLYLHCLNPPSDWLVSHPGE